jgi:hypothetical protein
MVHNAALNASSVGVGISGSMTKHEKGIQLSSKLLKQGAEGG